ncbi:MAG: DUF4364 family protein [Tissierellales bacterium]|jgi:predicted transcriptional regulator|nr:DUF4364 family protein [Tissierellales bacterium]
MFFEESDQIARHKLTLLYIIDKVDFRITNSEITQFVLESDFMNYFFVQQYLGEMIDASMIDIKIEDGNEYYALTPIGKETLRFFIKRIPSHIVDDINSKYEITKKEKIKEKQVIGKYYQKNDFEFIVNLKVIENDLTLFNLSLNVPSKEQAKYICNNWKSNPEYIYKELFRLLTENKDQI